MERAGDGSRVSPVADRVTRLEFDIEWPPKHVAAYLVEGPEPVLVDAGAPGEEAREQFVSVLASHGYEPEDVEHVVVTHPHTDHTGQVPLLLEQLEVALDELLVFRGISCFQRSYQIPAESLCLVGGGQRTGCIPEDVLRGPPFSTLFAPALLQGLLRVQEARQNLLLPFDEPAIGLSHLQLPDRLLHLLGDLVQVSEHFSTRFRIAREVAKLLSNLSLLLGHLPEPLLLVARKTVPLNIVQQLLDLLV